ncbi:MAG: type II secretion system protein GspD [Betaproteobacteria bacterium]
MSESRGFGLGGGVLPRRFELGLVLALALAVVAVALPQASMAQEILVTNVFGGADILSVLRDISAQTGVNIMAGATVQGWVTVELRDVPLDKALEMIVGPLLGYTFVEVGDYYVVGSADSKNPSFPLLTTTEVVKLNYVKAENAAKLLSDFFAPYVKVGAADNVLVVTAPASLVQRIKSHIERIDRPAPHVMLEPLVMEISSDSGKSFGADWLYECIGGQSDPTVPASGFVDFVLGIWGGKYNVTGGLEHIIASMKVLLDSGKAQIHATPRIATADGEPAEIFLGKDRYFAVATGSDTDTSTRLESIRTGISLKFTPRVSETGEILVKIEPEVSDAGETTEGLPLVNRRQAWTSIRVKDGETTVIGGLKLKSEYEVKSKVPLLGDLAVLGLLFSSTRRVAHASHRFEGWVHRGRRRGPRGKSVHGRDQLAVRRFRDVLRSAYKRRAGQETVHKPHQAVLSGFLSEDALVAALFSVGGGLPVLHPGTAPQAGRSDKTRPVGQTAGFDTRRAGGEPEFGPQHNVFVDPRRRGPSHSGGAGSQCPLARPRTSVP